MLVYAYGNYVFALAQILAVKDNIYIACCPFSVVVIYLLSVYVNNGGIIIENIKLYSRIFVI